MLQIHSRFLQWNIQRLSYEPDFIAHHIRKWFCGREENNLEQCVHRKKKVGLIGHTSHVWSERETTTISTNLGGFIPRLYALLMVSCAILTQPPTIHARNSITTIDLKFRHTPLRTNLLHLMQHKHHHADYNARNPTPMPRTQHTPTTMEERKGEPGICSLECPQTQRQPMRRDARGGERMNGMAEARDVTRVYPDGTRHCA